MTITPATELEIAFLNAHGTVTAVGVEGTSSYGLNSPVPPARRA
ncbi:hypothetical protein PV394_09975 [Streptomyces sp. NE06-03E]|nr:hypothetical protein [Streptomyces sp. NE06-03E]MDX3055460.1 hypothetical protein [Streptomyces sp. NE06-03E]